MLKSPENLSWKHDVAIRNRSLKEINEMASLVAHEIHNPLGGIRGFASLLQRDLQDRPELLKLATAIVEGVDTLDRIVNQLLNSSKPLNLDLELHDLTPILQDLILHLNADETIDPRIELRFEETVNLRPVFALVDPGRLKAALLHLASNAIQAMPEGGELRFSLSENATEVLIKVSDTGVGISEENRAKLFSPYFTTRPEGHGFGLAEVHKIIQAHHGEIDLESRLNFGTTFTIHLLKPSKYANR